MKLYHGTCESRLKDILQRGLRPRGEHGVHNWEETVPSNPNGVYMTVAYAPYFALQSSEPNERIVVLEIDTDLLDESRLCPDEDFLEQATREGDRDEYGKMLVDSSYRGTGHPEWGGMSMKQRTLNYQGVMQSEYGDKWEYSLQLLGTCAYLGTVPAKAITRFALYDAHDKTTDEINMNLVSPTITIMNFRIMGDFYRKFTTWFFGGTLTYEDIKHFTLLPGADVEMMRKQDKELFKHNMKAMTGTEPTDVQYMMMVADCNKRLKQHTGLEVYIRDGKHYKLGYGNGEKIRSKVIFGR